MADLNEVRISGVVPNFENAVRITNAKDEAHAFALLKLSVQHSQRKEDGSYENKDDIITFSAFRKTAQRVAKMAKPGTGLIIKAKVAPSQKVMKNGQDVLDQNGKPIWSGERLIIDSYDGINFVRDYSKKGDNSNAGSAQAAAPAAGFDIDAMLGGAPAVQTPAAAAPAKAAAPASDGFNIDNFPF